MSNLFQQTAADEIFQRLEKLQPGTNALWGKMTVSQMLAHCQAPLQVSLGEKQLKHSLMGMLFGKMAKRQMLKEVPFKKHLPTDASFVVKDERDFNTEQQKLKSLIQRFASADANKIAERSHPFFGKMKSEEWGVLGYKHLDHHLRQFDV